MPITALYASILTVIALVLAQLVIRNRVRSKVALGDGGDARLLEAMRRQANFVENVPLALILMLLAESGGAEALYLHIAGVALVAARILHPFGITVSRANDPLRIGATVATNTVQLGLVLLLLLQRFF